MSDPTASRTRGDGVVGDLDLQRTELTTNEVRTLGGFGDSGARVNLGAEVLQLTGERLGASSTGVHDDE